MADSGQQQVIAQEQGRRHALKHWARTIIRGNGGIRTVATRLTDVRAWGEGTITSAGRANRAYIRQFKDIHAGRRCVIIGNGPSLKDTDLSLLRTEITFGLNRIYLMFDELGFETTFHVVINNLVVEQCADDLRRIKAPLFTTTPNRKFLAGADTMAYLSKLVGPRFSIDASHGIWEGSTVTYVAMQLAHYMGFSQVILVGVDHRFAVSGRPHQVVESAGPDASHFDPRYFAKGFRWHLPDLETSELAYGLARRQFEKDGRTIVDATVDGALTVFPKLPLEEALGL
ncbi:6-hydroxymethylpterin diphosphokinase MptE-like protein [Mycolicibacterium tusciae]|uniref:6-hydroxymethylpterin diphosphokinase MptE-like protein n=1 Tax=Mycolicibacterium tusciae TaxID=75922 RepID=UPI00024A4C20|nr:6-hydroxymethylpterin diphosphokinase MptE-like protein [Mycolicibacterium tusciae]